MENAQLGPKYALRLRDLSSWHRLEATCFSCRHVSIIDPARLRQRWREDTKLGFLERKLRCRACGNIYGNSFAVGKLPRD